MRQSLLANRHENGSSPLYWIGRAILSILVLLGLVAFILAIFLMIWNADNIKRIQGVGPLNNEVFNLAGPGIAVSPNPPGHSLTYSNTGVLKVIPDACISIDPPLGTGNVTISNTGVCAVNAFTGNIVISSGNVGITVANAANTVQISNAGVLSAVAGPGISVSNPTGVVTIGNTGILSVSAGPGVTVNVAGGAATVEHTLTTQTQLAATSALGPQVFYSAVANFTNASEWTVATLSLLDGGQGAVGSTNWQIPSTGLYTVVAHCLVPENATVAHLVFNFGSTTTNPAVDGYLAGGNSAAPPQGAPQNFRLQATALVHAGCSGCLVAAGTALRVHGYLDVADVMTCSVGISKLL